MRNLDSRNEDNAQESKPSNGFDLFENNQQSTPSPGLFGEEDAPVVLHQPDPFAEAAMASRPTSTPAKSAPEYPISKKDPFAAEGTPLPHVVFGAKAAAPKAGQARNHVAKPTTQPQGQKKAASPAVRDMHEPANGYSSGVARATGIAAENAATVGNAALPGVANPAPGENAAPYKKGALHKHTGAPKSKTAERSKTAKPAPAPARAAERKRLRLNIIIASLIGVLVLALLFAALVPSCTQQAASSVSGSGSEMLVNEVGYDKNANSLPTGALSGTILAETKDAGKTYVEETLFLGDSNTVRMLLYQNITNVTKNNCVGVEGMGIQGALYEKCVRFSGYGQDITMAEAVNVLQPRRVVITFGTNNASSNQVESFIESYSQFLRDIEASYSAADIIIAAVPPIDKTHMNESMSMTTIDIYNVALAKLAEEKGYKFLNWSEALKDNSTGFAKTGYTIQDGVHLSETGLTAMFAYFRTHSYITEDNRPKPLRPIPDRLEIPKAVVVTPASSKAAAASFDVVSSSSIASVEVVSPSNIAPPPPPVTSTPVETPPVTPPASSAAPKSEVVVVSSAAPTPPSVAPEPPPPAAPSVVPAPPPDPPADNGDTAGGET